MNKFWNKIWVNLLFDAAIILILVLLFVNHIMNVIAADGQVEEISLGSKLYIGFIILLALHALFLLIISIVNFFHKNIFKGFFYFIHCGSLVIIIWFGSFLFFLPQFGAVYTDEPFVEARIDSCADANKITDKRFFSVLDKLRIGTDTADITSEAWKEYKEAVKSIPQTFSISKRGCRLSPEGVIVFKINSNHKRWYDVEMSLASDSTFVIEHFKNSLVQSND